MRKGMQGLALLVQEGLGRDPFKGCQSAFKIHPLVECAPWGGQGSGC
ncbi:hypothetical protein I6F15_27660 [Bradyrhizobium sp. BRP14]|nr:hypothetical protein [Bradyrhizobium sp. BRP14]